MKQFAKMAAATFVGIFVYDFVTRFNSYAVETVRRKWNRRKQEEAPSEHSCYSPKKSGRGTIGFKMQGEE